MNSKLKCQELDSRHDSDPGPARYLGQLLFPTFGSSLGTLLVGLEVLYPKVLTLGTSI